MIITITTEEINNVLKNAGSVPFRLSMGTGQGMEMVQDTNWGVWRCEVSACLWFP